MRVHIRRKGIALLCRSQSMASEMMEILLWIFLPAIAAAAFWIVCRIQDLDVVLLDIALLLLLLGCSACYSLHFRVSLKTACLCLVSTVSIVQLFRNCRMTLMT